MAGTYVSGTQTTPYILSDAATQDPFTLGVVGLITVANGVALTGDPGTAWTVLNEGRIEGKSGGIIVKSGGTIGNAAAALIAAAGSGGYAIQIIGGAGVVTNAGSILGSGSNADGIALQAGGSVGNSGTITGNGIGVQVTGGAATITNSGTVEAARLYGIVLKDGGTIDNQAGGLIYGAHLGVLAGSVGQTTITNAGTIAGGSAGTALELGATGDRLIIDPLAVFVGEVLGAADGSTLELASAASAGTLTGIGTSFVDFTAIAVDAGAIWTLTGVNAIGSATLTDAGTLINAGSLNGYATLQANAYLLNQASGTLSGGVRSAGTAVSVTNLGSIVSGDYAISLSAGGNVTNGSASDMTALISGSSVGIVITGGGSVNNAGTIIGYNLGGVLIASGGAVTNQAGGTISGFNGIVSDGPGTIVNAGSVGGGNRGISLTRGGSVTNESGGMISGGVFLQRGGSVTNQSGGTISGADAVVFGAGYTGLLVIDPGAVFTGTVDGGNVPDASFASTLELTQGAGTLAGLGSQFVNFADILIDSGASWVLASETIGADDTIINAGTIGGDLPGIAVELNATGDRLVIDPLAVFVGEVLGTTGGSTLELASSASAGTLTGLGTKYIDFPTITVDAGASWTLIADTIGAGYTIIDAGGTLTNTGSIGSAVTLAAGATLSNLSGGTISGFNGIGSDGPSTVVNAGSIGGSNQGVALVRGGSVTNQSGGVISGGVFLQRGGSITNQSGGTISGADAVVFGSGYTDLLVIDPGAVFTGLVNGGNAPGTGHVSTLELASSASAGTLTGLGSQFTNFANITIDPGANWTLVSDTVGAGYTITDAGTLTNTGSIGSTVTLAAGVTLSNRAGGTISGYIGVADAGAGAVVNAGNIDGIGGSQIGVSLKSGGSVTNQAGGTISGAMDAVAFGAGYAGLLVIDPGAVFTGTVDGGNTIGGSAVSTLELASGASAGTLTGLGTQFVNFANITIDPGANWTLASDTIGAGYTITDAGTLTNTGSIGSTVTLAADVTLSNRAGGTISGYIGVADAGAGAVVNAGNIGGSQIGVSLKSGGSVTNQAGGTISGAMDAVAFGAGYAGLLVIDPGAVFTGTVDGGNTIGGSAVSTLELASGASVGTLTGLGTQFVNFASITVDPGASWALAISSGSTFTNTSSLPLEVLLSGTAELVNTGTGTLSASSTAVYAASGGGRPTVVNAGSISGGKTGIDLSRGAGDVSNQSGGTIVGTSYGIILGSGTAINDGFISADIGITAAAAATVVNAGTISGEIGIELESGGAVTNQSGGTITGSGVYLDITLFLEGATTVVNAGLISHTNLGVGVSLLSGTLINQSSGTISSRGTGDIGAAVQAGREVGIYTFAPSTVVNAGTIDGGGRDGVELWSSGSVTNQSGGTIAGQTCAVYFFNGYEGRNYPNAGNDKLLAIDPGAVFIGLVYGGNTVGSKHISTLELASGASAGTLSGLGSKYVSFNNITIDSGAQWTLAADTIGTGYRFADAGSLTNSGSVGSAITLAPGGAIYNQPGGTISGIDNLALGSAVTVVNAGRIIGSSYGIWLSTDSRITNRAGGSIYGGPLGYGDGIYSGGAASIVNYGSIGGEMYGIHLFAYAGSSITNQAGVTISGGLDGISAFTSNADRVWNAGSIRGGENGIAVGGGGSVINLAGGTINGIGYDGIHAYRNALGVVNAGSIAGHRDGIYLGSGGSVTNQSGGTISGTDAVVFGAGHTDLLVIDPGAVFSGKVDGGNVFGTGHVSTLELGSGASAGTLTGLGSQFVNFGSIAFDQGADWFVEGGTAGLAGTISGFAVGDTIEIDGITVTGSSYADGVLTLDEASGSASLDLVGDFTTNEFLVTNVGGGAEITALCFCVNTLINTPTGARPVQDLAAGDLVTTFSGAERPIAWVGIGSVLATRGRRNAATPVIVRKGALGDNVPYLDLRVTKGHSFLVDDVLIPAEFLVNHRSILWDDRAQEVRLYHIELETHDVLVANGAPAESYRDDGNRWLFQNANTGWDQPTKPPCAPVLAGGPIVDAAWRRLLDRAGGKVRVPLTEEPDLHLLADGVRVDAVRRTRGAFVFSLAAVPESVRIVSRAAAPQELGLARDPRILGVALRQIALGQGARLRAIQANDPRLVSGFHQYESDNDFVWTNGDAVLPTDLLTGFSGPVEIVLMVASTTRYIDEGIRQRAA